MSNFLSDDELPPQSPLRLSHYHYQELDTSLSEDELPPPPPLSSMRRVTNIIVPQDTLINTIEKPYIIINGIKFTLIEKISIDNIVVISSEINSHNIQFKVYPSTSELGLWRLCLNTKDNDRYKYKGNYELKFDYIQTTLIHLDLQRFINDNLHKLSLKKNYVMAPCNEKNGIIKEIIDDQSRIIWNHPPFNTYYDKQCGLITNPEIVKDFSEEFKREYNIDLNSITIIIPNYSNIFEEIFHITGDIFSIQLNRKIPNIEYNETNSVILYYFKSKINKLRTNEYEEQINNICGLDTHIMPFLLTPFDTRCNVLGLYTKYISTGAFICKLFDYSSDTTKQCTDQENAWGKCTRKYSYIGLRYQNIFPFNEIIAHNCRIATEINTNTTKQILGGKKTKKTKNTKKYKKYKNTKIQKNIKNTKKYKKYKKIQKYKNTKKYKKI
jgi:hypothetical protein